MQKKKLGPTTLLYPMPAVLVGTVIDGRPNFMTAAWCGIANMSPPAVSVAIRGSRLTLEGIEKTHSFSLNIPSVDQVEKVDFCGIYSGRKVDKSKLFTVFTGVAQPVPLIEECPLGLECRLLHDLELGTHHLLVGEIVETHIDEALLEGDEAVPEKIDPLLYCPGKAGHYYALGKRIAKAFHVGKKGGSRS